MRILVHEFVSGGGLAGRPIPPSLLREGSAMLAALVEDLACAVPPHRIIATADERVPMRFPRGVEVAVLEAGSGDRRLDSLIQQADAVWFVAPETGGCLERLARRAERLGRTVLGSSAAGIRVASDKAGLARILPGCGVPYPLTRVVLPEADRDRWNQAAEEIGYPVVVKPWRGAGCEGVVLAGNEAELDRAVAMARRIVPGEPLLMQPFVSGAAMSVSLLSDGRHARVLTVNTQRVRPGMPFVYLGGTTPFEHPRVQRAVELAVRTCEGLGGLRGYVGVDFIAGDRDAVVIEVNPRLTTAYIGVRAALQVNVAAIALAACAGELPPPMQVVRQISFSSAGRTRRASC